MSKKDFSNNPAFAHLFSSSAPQGDGDQSDINKDNSEQNIDSGKDADLISHDDDANETADSTSVSSGYGNAAVVEADKTTDEGSKSQINSNENFLKNNDLSRTNSVGASGSVETKSVKRQIYLQPSVFEAAQKAAAILGLSVNEFFHRAIDMAARDVLITKEENNT